MILLITKVNCYKSCETFYVFMGAYSLIKSLKNKWSFENKTLEKILYV